MDTAEQGGADDDQTPDRCASSPRYLPSSMGMSLLVEPGAQALRVTGREQREVTCDVPLSSGPPIALADTDGLEIARHIRQTQVRTETGDRNVLAVSHIGTPLSIRVVEATSAAPFAPRALDSGLAAVIVGLAGPADGALTPNSSAAAAEQMRPQLAWVADVFRERVRVTRPARLLQWLRMRGCALGVIGA